MRLVYVRRPSDVCGPEMCGRLNKAIYGCRDAAQCWEAEITDFFTSVGFTPGIGSPVLFVNLTRELRVTIHGDDITALGSEANLLWLKQQLETRYELKYGGMLGQDAHDVQDAMVLNRLIHYSVEEDVTTYEADPRHVHILLNELNLVGAKAVTTPGVNRKHDESSPKLDAATTSRFRSLVMRANYLALDRPDLHFSAKELARCMRAPSEGELARLARFLCGRPRLVWVYKQQEEPGELTMFSDSDDGGCSKSRKSTLSGVLMHGQNLIKAYSSTQHIISLSSGESEFYGEVCAGAALIGARSMAEDLGCTKSGALVFDASAAKAMLTRRRFGRAKHIHRSFLWLQQKIGEQELELRKVGTRKNVADLGTKHLEASRIEELISEMNLKYDQTEHRMTLHV